MEQDSAQSTNAPGEKPQKDQDKATDRNHAKAKSEAPAAGQDKAPISGQDKAPINEQDGAPADGRRAPRRFRRGRSRYVEPRVAVEVRHPPRRFFGTDYPYPTDFQVIPMFVRGPDGKRRFRPIVVPTRFERRTSGTVIRYYR